MALPAQTVKQNALPDENVQLDAVLNALAKAIKALNFYPPEHPQREESITAAFNLLAALVRERELILVWSRDACAVADRTDLRSTSATAKALAREMLTRKLQRLIVLPRLSLPDLKNFLSILATDAATIYAGGGIEAEIARAGITSIAANEVNLLLLKGGLQEEEPDKAEEITTVALEAEETLQEHPPEEESESVAEPEQDTRFSLLGIDILLGMLKAERQESPFLQLAREIIDATEELKRQEAFDALLPVIESLLEVHAEETRTNTQKEFIRYALEQIVAGAMTAFLLDLIEERAAPNAAVIDRLCEVIGQTLAYPLIQRLCVAETLQNRKALANALTKTGEAGTPALVAMLRDERWYVVRNMVTILGEITSAEAVKALQSTAKHPEAKVRKEVVKSLLKIAPRAGEAILITMLDDVDRDVVRQVIFSLGMLRSRIAVKPLLEIVTAADAFLKEVDLKKQSVAALGRIGDHEATGPLMDILVTRGWLAPRRWTELKVAAATALGQMGDESALPLLQRLAKHDTPVGEACADAAETLERILK